MSTFKHALPARDAHIRTLHIALVALAGARDDGETRKGRTDADYAGI